MSLDRDLLPGLLAWQLGFLTHEALVTGTRTWAADRDKSLAQVLAEQGVLPAPRSALLEALAREVPDWGPGQCLEAARSLSPLLDELRQVVTPAGAVPPTLSTCLVPIPDPHSTRVVSEAAPPAGTGTTGVGTSSDRRFLIVRLIGRGGIGEVFVARDEELRRDVALKQIQGQHAADPRSRARFLREAEVTGGLEHPGIVPVHGLGTGPDGRPFYAMRLIRGEDLEGVLHRFHQSRKSGRKPSEQAPELRKLLRSFLDVCNAVEYAHSRGVIHRDLKPANVMIGPYGETLVVDWGLAKTLGDREASDSSLVPVLAPAGMETVPGTTLGTPAYMSPEQAAGRVDQVGPTSDVYSLGATLYCVLTGEAPFQGGDLSEVLQKVQRGEFPTPRQLNPHVPAALEAVCLQAMARQPGERYPSARALAEDVEHWMADEPVSAFRDPLSARLGRWARRHRPLVTGLAALLVTAVVALAVGLGLLGREQARTREARDEAQAQAEQLRRSLYYTRVGLAQGELTHANLGRVTELLESCPPELLGWEWRYLTRSQRHGDRGPVCRHGGFALAVAFSPDGRLLASGSLDGTVRVTDVTTGLEVHRFRSGFLPVPVLAVTFSPDGKHLAAGLSTVVSGAVKVWDVATGREVFTLRDSKGGGVVAISYSPDGRHLASGGWDKALHVWDVGRREKVLDLKGHSDTIYALAYHADGRRLASTGWDGTIRVWDVETGGELLTIRADPGELWCLACSPDGRRLAAGGLEGSVRVWDAASGEPLLRIQGHHGFVQGVTFSPDGTRLATAAWDRTVKLWDARTGQDILALRGHTDVVSAVTFSRDGRLLASAGWDGAVRLWDATPLGPRDSQDVRPLDGHGGLVTSVSFSPDGKRLVSSSMDGTARIWDTDTGQVDLVFREHRGYVYKAVFSPDGRKVATAGRGEIILWDAATGKELVTYRGHVRLCTGLAFSPNGKRVASAAGYDGLVKVWDASNGKDLFTLDAHLIGVQGVTFSPDGRLLATTGNDRLVKVWKAEDGSRVHTLFGHGHIGVGVAFGPDSKTLASASWDGAVKLWDVSSGKELPVPFERHADRVISVAFSPDGKRLATSTWDGTARLWDAASGKALATFRGHAGLVLMTTFSPNGKTLATASGQRDRGEIKLWDLRSLGR